MKISSLIKSKNFAVMLIAVGLGVILVSLSMFQLLNNTNVPSYNGSTAPLSETSESGTPFPVDSQNSSDKSHDSADSSETSETSESNSTGSSSVSAGISSGASSTIPTPAAGDIGKLFSWPKPSATAIASVDLMNGLPRLSINNKVVPPLMFFGNTDMKARYDVLKSQFRKAAAGNIHLHSIISSPSVGGDQPPEVQYFGLDNDLDTMLEGDPEGYALIRVNVGKYWNTASYPQDEIVQYTASRSEYSPMVSIASERWFSEAKTMLREMVGYIRSHPTYSKHVIGYHLECGEWFQYMFRENGADISPANSRKFREWLTTKYKTDSALKTAWADSSITLKTASVPADLPGNTSFKPEDRTMLLDQSDTRYTDYLDYIGDLVSSRIEGLAKEIKQASGNENIVIAFYGYLFELADPQSGHFSLNKLIASPYLDGFASPESYVDRNVGELLPNKPAGSTGAYMTIVDSVQRAGKLWFVESDQRTFINRYNAETEHDSYLTPMETIAEVIEVSKRDVGVNMLRGAAIWFMDLWAVGWLDDQAIWDNNGKLADLYQAYADSRKSRPQLDVAVVVDEKAMSLIAQPTDSAWHFLSYQRFDIYRSGVKFGLFSLKDLMDGQAKDAKAVFFLTPFRLTSTDTDKIMTAVKGKTIVFSYGFGNTASADISKLTGMDIRQLNDRIRLRMTPVAQASVLDLAGKTHLGADVYGSPRWYAAGGYDSAVGKYSDGKIGFAVKDTGNHKAVFFGGMRMDPDVIRGILDYAGNVPVFTESDDVFAANEDMMVIHSSAAGVKTLRFPRKCDVYDYFKGTWYTGVSSIKVSMEYGETRYFFYGSKSDLLAMKLPDWK